MSEQIVLQQIQNIKLRMIIRAEGLTMASPTPHYGEFFFFSQAVF